MKVFVYGTLRNNETNHHFLHNSICLAEQAWVQGEMFDTGYGYPTILQNETDKVYGEVYEIDQPTLNVLDVLEGYDSQHEDSLFARVKSIVFTDVGLIHAYTYIAGSHLSMVAKIAHGDWKLHQLIQSRPKEVHYFAYGSCMDVERFQLAGVHHYFDQVIGAAVLEGYSMKYLFHAKDGGRADILEDGGMVEGILYKIPYEGVEYLFKREGFYGGWYRPTFIHCTVNNTIYRDVLTFHVYDKKEELAPPAHYSTEILRGASGRVSANYYKELEAEINRLHTSKPADKV